MDDSNDFSLTMRTMDSVVKQEPAQEMMGVTSASASVPIPGGHRGTRGIYDQLSPSPLAVTSGWTMRADHMESPFKLDPDQLDKMDDDDIFQVDKADLLQGPTLAELNTLANDDTLLGDLNFDDLVLPEERTIQPIKVEANVPSSTGSLFSSSTVGFAPSSFPQTGSTFRSCPTYANTYIFNINKDSNADNMEPVSPTAFPSPGTSNIAGISE